MANKPETSRTATAPLRTPSPRGRPSVKRAAAIEDAILDVAHALFLELGYQGLTMEGVAARAGVSKGTLYARYIGKEPLFRAVIAKRLDIWSVMAGSGDHLLPRELKPRLMHHARTLARMFAWPEYQQTSRLIQTAANLLPDIAVFWHEHGTRRFVEFLADDMAAVAEVGGSKPPDWRFLAGLFLHGFSGWYAIEMTSGPVSEERADRFALQLIDTILASLAVHSGPELPRSG